MVEAETRSDRRARPLILLDDSFSGSMLAAREIVELLDREGSARTILAVSGEATFRRVPNWTATHSQCESPIGSWPELRAVKSGEAGARVGCARKYLEKAGWRHESTGGRHAECHRFRRKVAA